MFRGQRKLWQVSLFVSLYGTALCVVPRWVLQAASAQILNESGKLVAPDGAPDDRFGNSVSMSGDTAVVGAFFDDDAGTNSGSAYVFVRAGGVWTLQQKLTASDATAGAHFGYYVSIDGDTAIIAAPSDGTGSAYVFVRSGGVWAQQQKLAETGVGTEYAYSVSVSGDTVVVGAVRDSDLAGSAFVYVRTGTVWTLQKKLTALDATGGDQFGHSVSLSGNTALVGAKFADCTVGSNCGAAYVFVRSDVNWTQQQKLTASDAAVDDWFGLSVTVSGDTAVVGAPSDDCAAGTNCGSAYVYVRSGEVWTEQQKLTAADAAMGDEFGDYVSVSGNTTVVAAAGDDCAAGIDCGSAYVFVRSGGAWTQQHKLTASDASTGDLFGIGVSVNGNTALVGAYLDDNAGGSDAGAAYVFVLGGACCLNNGTCLQLFQSECESQGGVFHGLGTNCQSDIDQDGIADMCDSCIQGPGGVCIPTLSGWGLVSMGLFTLAAGMVVVRRRQHSVA